MPDRPKILLVDDDADILDLYQELLGRLPCQPEVYTSSTGARAIAMLEDGSFNLLITDLNMPQMDGLQVLTIVRRKFPQLRTVVLTAITDEQFRSRAYSLGLDLYFVKPTNSRETRIFVDCIQSLLEQKQESGFRGMESKSLMDIIQLESLCRNSTVLKVNNGPLEGRIWFQNGEVFDAETEELSGQEAFQRILSWKKGSFECLPADPNRERKILDSINGLLLNTMQALDESQQPADLTAGTAATAKSFDWAKLVGLEFAVVTDGNNPQPLQSWSTENAVEIGAWATQTMRSFHDLGEVLQVGQPVEILGLGLHYQVGIALQENHCFCLGFHHSRTATQTREKLHKTMSQWHS